MSIQPEAAPLVPVWRHCHGHQKDNYRCRVRRRLPERFLGRKRKNGAAMVPDVEAEVRWRPFQLDPTLPPRRKDRQTYMRDKFGTGGKRLMTSTSS